MSLLGRDVAADAAAKLSETARPDSEALRQVDQPAPSNEWVGPDGETRSHKQAVPDSGLADMRDQVRNTGDNLKQVPQQHGAESKERMQSAADHGSSRHSTDADRATASTNAAKNQASEESQRLKDKITNRIPQQHKDLAKEHYNMAKVRSHSIL